MPTINNSINATTSSITTSEPLAQHAPNSKAVSLAYFLICIDF